MRFVADEIVGCIQYGRFAGAEIGLGGRVCVSECFVSWKRDAAEVVVPLNLQVSETAKRLQVGEEVWVETWNGQATGVSAVAA
ncbi:MAG: hypothetical protein U0744_09975 [Gemmataceae bacterium]